MPIKFHEAAWDDLLLGVVDRHLKPRAEEIAHASNEQMKSAGHGSEDDAPGYMAGTEGEKPLRKGDYRATVITVTNSAKYDNAANNRLVNNFHLAEHP